MVYIIKLRRARVKNVVSFASPSDLKTTAKRKVRPTGDGSDGKVTVK